MAGGWYTIPEVRIDDGIVRERLSPPEGVWKSREGLRDSAVLAVLVAREGVDHLLFNRRHEDLPDHSGQVCFPGGCRENEEDAVACALRETSEEVGLAPEELQVLGRLPDRISIEGFLVTPFAARWQAPADYALATDEVVEAFEVPCPALLEAERWSHRPIQRRNGQTVKIPFFDWEGRTVWGLTGIILRDFCERVLDFRPH